ncbi:sialate O-acetylesterase [Flavihumibacter sp. RY-1]|uniref:Sialate O-acetylesterase n=1 Tax=Flavihumibacter fluminis TaxID=2909236 RepID=A0ABS9BHJ9_9BACT|nr:sialate O-acetylesterase [Flavihumibacter fluminis]MCF1714324.1 sialate O-acetylesterase [Flavihumibacter fluminis]
MKNFLQRCLPALLILICSAGFSQLRLPAILQSGMVLQQKDSVNLWGWAGPGEKVTVTTGWDKKQYETTASDLARWILKVKTPAAGGPYSITITSRNTIVLEDVLIGEVWVCSGQSNMEWSFYNGVKDIAPEFPTAANASIRLFHVNKTGADFPQDDLKASWAKADSNQLKSFSAVGYFFGKNLHEKLNVPIGLINVSWGGTPAEAWTPEAVVTADPQLKAAAAKLKKVAWWPTAPAQAYNGMIAPITLHGIAGVIWYQGESNTGTYSTYRQLFTSMIDSWRAAWKKDLPFYYVQIAPFKYGTTGIGALLREAQAAAASHPNTGMVVITDLVDTVTDIHPSRKKPVGTRLANYALASTYNLPIADYRSPEYSSSAIEKGKILVKFNYAEKGIRMKGANPEGWLISDINGTNWLVPKVKIEKNNVILWHPDLKNPMFVRYGFGNTSIGNMESAAGLPLAPFRTDHFPIEQIPEN